MKGLLSTAALVATSFCVTACSRPTQVDNKPMESRYAAFTVSNTVSLKNSRFTVKLIDSNQAATIKSVHVDLTMPAMPMPPDIIPLHLTASGTFTGTGTFTMAGTWDAKVIGTEGAGNTDLGTFELNVSD